MGQSLVQNLLKTETATSATSGPPPLMRYPGEWLFPGGGVEPSDRGDLLQTARGALRQARRA